MYIKAKTRKIDDFLSESIDKILKFRQRQEGGGAVHKTLRVQSFKFKDFSLINGYS